jgi:hypothetical protein
MINALGVFHQKYDPKAFLEEVAGDMEKNIEKILKKIKRKI